LCLHFDPLIVHHTKLFGGGSVVTPPGKSHLVELAAHSPELKPGSNELKPSSNDEGGREKGQQSSTHFSS
jgi:hypothetical protein